MHLFEVIRWGNDSDDLQTGGPNGPDTCFLVRAESVDDAARMVDRWLVAHPSVHVPPWAGAVYLLGTEISSASEPRILRGPYVQHAYTYGWRQWFRNAADQPWTEKLDR